MKRFIGATPVVALAAAMLVFGSLVASAQERTGQGEGRQGVRQGERRGPGGERGDFDPARMREMMVERMRESLAVSDDEWKAIKPLIEKVFEKQTAARMGGMRGMMGGRRGGERRGGPEGTERQRPASPGDAEVEALSKALEAKDTPAADIEAKLKALRDARKKAEEELQAARTELRKVLTVRQEAELVLRGILD